MLQLVLHHQAEHEAVLQQRIAVRLQTIQHLQRAPSHVVDERAGRRRLQEGQLAPLGARVGECVVDVVVLGVQRRIAADVPHQPKFLEVPDVRKVPDERRLQRRHLPRQLLLGQPFEQCEGTRPRLLQGLCDPVPLKTSTAT